MGITLREKGIIGKACGVDSEMQREFNAWNESVDLTALNGTLLGINCLPFN